VTPGNRWNDERVAEGSVVAAKRSKPAERRDPAVCNDSNKKGGKGEMTKAPICLQDLRRSLYVKAKAELTWRFWGLYVHVCKMETLHEAYQMAKKNDGAPESTVSRSKPSKRAERKVFFNRLITN
jgi:hypothetical protein